MSETLLETKNLTIHYEGDFGTVRAVNGVDLKINKGETLGLVGETGAGKTTTALGILRLIPSPPGRIVDGTVMFQGADLIKKTNLEMRKIRGNKIAMVFQDPMTALNPVITVGDQITETIRLHDKVSRVEAREKARSLLALVGISSDRLNEYPHQFSGGMKQRVVIAIALSCDPALLVADEPTTALDVTIQAQVLELIASLKTSLGTSMLLITHDLGIVAEICDKVAIMYAGEIVEYGDVRQIYGNARHPYTKGLFESLPGIDHRVNRLKPIDGIMPDPARLPEGCRFHPRCPFSSEICRVLAPEKTLAGEGHYAKCHFPRTKGED